MNIPIALIDAFTSEPFKGNPAAVCLLQEGRNAAWMQRVASEMNQSETAFVVPREDGSYSLRWFTPTVEVDLCGHATMASAHYLWESGHLPTNSQARFHTLSGLLTADLSFEGIMLNFPAEPAVPVTAPEELIQGLGLIPRAVSKNRIDYLVEIDSEDTVRTLQPDFAMLSRVEARGVIVTSKANRGSEYDFVSRAFYPATGCEEDPVTGSAHCALAPYWQRKLRKDDMLAYQASARGGELKLAVVGSRILISGKAVTVLNGHLSV
ncbi:PhzF family phenazine biosynthesis protein [Paenibacillus taihuensis]|uniref:PhzF family phenazine biosynthesis protein n=1 Tax=Paenibacillus taihuensis TaxID=1156355 RepID=A0A3D9RWN9_9BACL|nr:PhzF family phenazine biosynthesis protein [Paenibacillus taihuensis]REE84409.1 PhzF family phenazine biosynthesis protein [Paenibacillus taihuensis]